MEGHVLGGNGETGSTGCAAAEARSPSQGFRLLDASLHWSRLRGSAQPSGLLPPGSASGGMRSPGGLPFKGTPVVTSSVAGLASFPGKTTRTAFLRNLEDGSVFSTNEGDEERYGWGRDRKGWDRGGGTGRGVGPVKEGSWEGGREGGEEGVAWEEAPAASRLICTGLEKGQEGKGSVHLNIEEALFRGSLVFKGRDSRAGVVARWVAHRKPGFSVPCKPGVVAHT